MSWLPFVGGHTAPARPAPPPAAEPAATPAPPSVFRDNQIVVFYGTPRSSGMGILGVFQPGDMAQRLRDEAAVYDSLNGDRGATGAMDLIYGMVTGEPGRDGIYVGYLDDATVRRYIDLAETYDQQVILDLQIGRSDPLTEVRKIEPYLRNPRVHVAIDPEYAVGPAGVPVQTPGRVTGEQINQVQDYVVSLVEQYGLPSKMVIVHQFMEHTVVGGEAVRTVPGVDLVLNMDAFGDVPTKRSMYERFAASPLAHHRSYNVFLRQDDHVQTEDELLRLAPSPDMFMYQ